MKIYMTENKENNDHKKKKKKNNCWNQRISNIRSGCGFPEELREETEKGKNLKFCCSLFIRAKKKIKIKEKKKQETLK